MLGPRAEAHPDFLSGGGEMGERMRAHDWQSSLGAPKTWPPQLTTLVGVMLASQQPKFLAWGPDRIWFSNDAFIPILGDKHPQALGQPATAVWAEAWSVLEPLFARVFAGEAVHMEDFGLPLDRHGRVEEAHFAFGYTPVRDEKGQVIGLFGNCIETTGQVRALRDLAKSEGQFRTLAQAMPHHVWTAPADGLLDWFNDRVYEYSGAAPGTLDGIGWTVMVHADDLPRASARWAEALGAGKAYETEFRLRHADGSYRWHIARAVPIKDEAGTIVRWIGTNTDIEEERQTRLSLSEAQNELNILLNSTASAFYSVGRDGATTSCNAEFLRILGFGGLSTVVGKKLHDIIHHTHPDGRPYPKEACPIYLCAQNGTEAHVREEFFYRKDGTPVPVEYWVRPLFRDGVLTGAICNFNDISERKYADEQRALLIGELNHRVKNLFALVSGIIALSARNAATPKELAAALQGRLGALSRAHELIQPGLRAHDSGAPSGVDLPGLIDQIFAPYSSSHLDERIKIAGPKIALSGESVTGMALIFHELATNAAKYGALHETGGKLAIQWHTRDGNLELSWLESGCQPRPAEPEHQGFGSMLLRRTIESQFGGSLTYGWKPDGLSIAITALLSRLSKR
jgi:PAS domain S-box-containing protein